MRGAMRCCQVQVAHVMDTMRLSAATTHTMAISPPEATHDSYKRLQEKEKRLWNAVAAFTHTKNTNKQQRQSTQDKGRRRREGRTREVE